MTESLMALVGQVSDFLGDQHDHPCPRRTRVVRAPFLHQLR
jgi:hypothetical protein